ncbi:MAG: hypothetical protein A3D94_10665 [Alphaproteobacteria bacterium RIFCSPHIGHO2_12_FULL_66_14]|jgi:hypothetical protein|nr:MAG: hypothetical protein A3D94_10665 [Alphaproteobacteria bacterium RIFCSPHIGHO2_12_FULL_66_14]
MNFLRQSTRAILATLVLSLSACNSVSILKGSGYSDPRLSGRIDRAYEARDACLAKNAAPSISGELDIANIAKAVSLSCMPETDRLIAMVNPHHDPRVTTAMLKDNDDKAMRYVMLARGEARS